MIEVSLPDGSVVEFPDGTPPDAMERALSTHVQSSPGPHDGTQSWGDVASSALYNFPSSAGNVLNEAVNAVLHPIDTAGDVWNVASGAVQKMIPGQYENEKYADAVGRYFANRYGSMDEFKNALAQDPAGVLADISSVFTGGGALAKGVAKVSTLGNAAKAAGIAEKAGNIASSVASATDPFSLAMKGAGRAADAMTSSPYGVAGRLYQSALKPSTAMPMSDRNRLIETGLKERISPTQRGYDKAQGLISDIGQDIEGRINIAAQGGATIEPAPMAQSVKADMDRLFSNQVTPSSDLATVADTVSDFTASHQTPLALPEAQALKQGTYRMLKDKAYSGELKSASVETQKAFARSLKEQLEQNIPGLKDLNARQGALIELTDPLERAAGRTGNWNMTSLGSHIGGGATLGRYDPVTAAAVSGFMNVGRMPAVKANLAYLLDSGKMPEVLHNVGATGYAGGTTRDILSEMFPKENPGTQAIMRALMGQ